MQSTDKGKSLKNSLNPKTDFLDLKRGKRAETEDFVT